MKKRDKKNVHENTERANDWEIENKIKRIGKYERKG